MEHLYDANDVAAIVVTGHLPCAVGGFAPRAG